LYLIFSDPEVKKLINSKVIVPTNYGLWRLLTESKKIKLPPGFISPGSPDIVDYEQIINKKNTSLYYYLYRDVLLSRKVIGKDDRCFIKNTNKLVFTKYEQIDVSIVIPVYGALELVNQTLLSLYRADIKNCEIICVDDCAPTNSFYDYAMYENIVVVKNKQNMGFSNTCNNGVKHARGKYVLLLNSDTVVCKSAVELAIDKLKSDPKIGIVGSKLLNIDGTVQEAGGIIWSNSNVINFMRGKNNYTPYTEFDRFADYVSGAAFFFSKDFWVKLNGFDKQFSPAYYEDTEICVRAKSKGYKVVYCHDSEIIHAEGGTNGTDIRSGIKSFQEKNKNKFKLLWKNYISKNYAPEGETLLALANGRKIVFYIDHYIPKNGSDAGSKATIHLIDDLIARNYFVIFWPDNLFPDNINRKYLAKKGVLTFYGSEFLGKISIIIDSVESRIEKIFLSRPHISIKYLNQINKNLMSKTVYIGHDIHHERLILEDKLKIKGNLISYTDRLDIQVVRQQEHLLWRSCGEVAYFTKREASHVNKLIGNNCAYVIPLFKKAPVRDIQELTLKKNGFLFVGGFDHHPNRDGLIWLIKGLKDEDEEFKKKITIVGSKIPQDIKNLLRNNKILFFENLSNRELDELYFSTKIVIAPLRFGSGLKGKIVEAIERKIPLIGTTIAYQGLEFTDSVRPVDEVKKFIEKMKFMINNDSACKEEQEAQYIMLNNYFLEASYDNFFKEKK
jgi:GT2 family glycosyltransferase